MVDIPDVRVFISWSGLHSRATAETLGGWLESVIPGVSSWISSEDIAVGRNWFSELMRSVQSCNVCIICVTDENLNSPWIYYEAGAIAANGGRNEGQAPLICSYLISVEGPRLAGGPLSQFQWAQATRAGTWEMVQSINRNIGAKCHHEDLLRLAFNSKWPILKRKLGSLRRPDERNSAVKIDAIKV